MSPATSPLRCYFPRTWRSEAPAPGRSYGGRHGPAITSGPRPSRCAGCGSGRRNASMGAARRDDHFASATDRSERVRVEAGVHRVTRRRIRSCVRGARGARRAGQKHDQPTRSETDHVSRMPETRPTGVQRTRAHRECQNEATGEVSAGDPIRTPVRTMSGRRGHGCSTRCHALGDAVVAGDHERPRSRAEELPARAAVRPAPRRDQRPISPRALVQHRDLAEPFQGARPPPDRHLPVWVRPGLLGLATEGDDEQRTVGASVFRGRCRD
jgi:hypothetical protein